MHLLAIIQVFIFSARLGLAQNQSLSSIALAITAFASKPAPTPFYLLPLVNSLYPYIEAAV